MKVGGLAIGIGIIVLTLIVVVASILYNKHLEQQRTQAVAQLVSMPQYANCKYDAATCPQAAGNIAIPDTSGFGLIVLGLLLGAYLIRNDATQRKVLKELEGNRLQVSREERRELLLSVLTEDERKIINAVLEQPGISQATLRLRTDMSKAKLSQLLKDLEKRNLIGKVEHGKTNAVHVKREI